MILTAALSACIITLFAEERTLTSQSVEIDGVTYTIINPDNELIEYADNTTTRQERKSKRNSTSTSTSKSVSTSNGKTTTTISTNRSGNQDTPKEISELAIYQFLSDKYKREPGCRLTIIDNNVSHYRSIRVHSNKEVIEKIRNAVDKDKSRANGVTQDFDENKDVIIMQFDNAITVGYTEYVDGDGCELFLSYI